LLIVYSDESDLIKIIVDEPTEEDALDFQRYSQNLAGIIRETNPAQFAVGIFGKWGTGKTSLMKMIRKDLDADKDKILTVWFDAWRYEREKYLAVIPFLRQIRIALDNDLAENKKTPKWRVLRKGLNKTFTAFLESTDVSVSLQNSPVSTTTNLEKFANSLRSKGSTWYGGEHVQFHEHATDFLRDALDVLEKQTDGRDSRIVVFVDDLDRCTPEKALEVLESIKSFFAIKGIVYVIGMDSDSIDYIVKQKYGEHSNIKGIDYLQKIVQVPFQIPGWESSDISSSIPTIILKGLKGSELAGEFEDLKRRNLIAKVIEPNPRQLKRFVNSVILARSVLSKNGEGVKEDIDNLIVVQALNFRPEWNRFLKLITQDNIRLAFFEKHYVPLREKGNPITSSDNNPLPKKVIDIFRELIREDNSSLRGFLDEGADKILSQIKEMRKYRRALEATELTTVSKTIRSRYDIEGSQAANSPPNPEKQFL
jgi:hypothetical protein